MVMASSDKEVISIETDVEDRSTIYTITSESALDQDRSVQQGHDTPASHSAATLSMSDSCDLSIDTNDDGMILDIDTEEEEVKSVDTSVGFARTDMKRRSRGILGHIL